MPDFAQSLVPNLHDAVFGRVDIVWGESEAVARIVVERVPGGPTVLTARGLSEFTITRHEDWGRSVSVNNARTRTTDAGEVALRIEMQSGDTITLVAAHLTVT